MPSLSEETNGRIERLMPGATIGIIGGGQLGRMMALSARYMGFRIGVLDPTPDCPTAQVADFQVTAEYDDIAAIRELAEKSDVLTYEFENVDADAIDQVRSLAAAPQGTDLLRVTQDRVNEKRFINDHGTPTAPWKAVNSVEELEAALDEIHYPAVLKTRSGGYDGHGQTVLKSEADLEQVRARADHDGSFPPSILEGFVDFAFEASILVAGNGKDYVTFPIVRNEHRNNILHMTIAPAEVDETVAKEAHELALRLAKGFELAGILAIELFITKDNKVIVNVRTIPATTPSRPARSTSSTRTFAASPAGLSNSRSCSSPPSWSTCSASMWRRPVRSSPTIPNGTCTTTARRKCATTVRWGTSPC
mgnify:CR=1 FL=1